MVIFWFDLFYILSYVGDVYSLTTNLLKHLVFVQKVFMKVHMVIVLIFSKILSASFFFFFLHWWCCWQSFSCVMLIIMITHSCNALNSALRACKKPTNLNMHWMHGQS